MICYHNYILFIYSLCRIELMYAFVHFYCTFKMVWPFSYSRFEIFMAKYARILNISSVDLLILSNSTYVCPLCTFIAHLRRFT